VETRNLGSSSIGKTVNMLATPLLDIANLVAPT
jgi:hypothetical protein